jgi:hypothetical protein
MATATYDLPEGVAAAITMQAPYGTDVEYAPGARPRSRDRGRFYFGPLNQQCLLKEADGSSSWTIPFKNCMTQWLKVLNAFTSTAHSVNFLLGVWSRQNAIIKSLAEGWLDDRPDYQRRRAGVEGSKQTILLP